MLTEQEKVELAALEGKCLDLNGDPRDDVIANDLMRLSFLQEKAEAEGQHDVVPIENITVAELKEIAKKKKIKGYGGMNKEALLAALESLQDEVEDAGNSVFIKSLEAKGYEYLGKNSRGQYFIGPDKKAYSTNAKGVLSSVGNTFGDKLLKSLTK